MTLEAPIQIDLSDDNSWDQIDDSLLSDEEKQILREHFTEDTEGIIYLTQQELQTLKDAIDISDLPNMPDTALVAARTQDINSFIDEQIEEWISLEDIFSHVEWFPEVFNWLGDNLDTVSQELLFGANGIMDDVELTDTAKDHITTSLSIAWLQAITNLEWLTAENFQESFRAAIENLNAIKQVFSQTETTDDGDVPYTSIVHIAGEWELNSIFMNSAEGIAFFEGIISWTITEDQIESYVEERNTEAWDSSLETDLSALSWVSREALEGVLWQIWLNLWTNDTWTTVVPQAITTPTDTPIVVPEDPEERLSFIERLQNGSFFEKILAVILSLAGGSFDNWGNDTTETVIDWPEPEEVAAQTREQARSFFEEHADEWIFTWMSRSSIEALFPSNGELPEEALRLLELIDAIPPLWEWAEEKMNHIFIDTLPASDSDDSRQVPRLERFLSDMKEITNTEILVQSTDGSLDTSNLITAVNAYKSYRLRNEEWKQLPENENIERNMTFREYFEENITETDE